MNPSQMEEILEATSSQIEEITEGDFVPNESNFRSNFVLHRENV